LPRPSLATETLAEAELEDRVLAALLNAEVSVTEIILQALEARIVGLKKVVQLRWLLVAGWVRGCARLYGVHSGHPLSVGRVPGCVNTRGAIFLPAHIVLQIFTNDYRYARIFTVNYRPWRWTWTHSRSCESTRDSPNAS
jgi:hypothetical protein